MTIRFRPAAEASGLYSSSSVAMGVSYPLRTLFKATAVVVVLSMFIGVVLRWMQPAPLRIITDRSEWPHLAEEHFPDTLLALPEVKDIELVSHGIDGWVARIPASDTTTTWAQENFVPIASIPNAAIAQGIFWGYLPEVWAPPNTATWNLLAHPRYDTDEGGNGTAYTVAVDEAGGWVYVCFFYNF